MTMDDPLITKLAKTLDANAFNDPLLRSNSENPAVERDQAKLYHRQNAALRQAIACACVVYKDVINLAEDPNLRTLGQLRAAIKRRAKDLSE